MQLLRIDIAFIQPPVEELGQEKSTFPTRFHLVFHFVFLFCMQEMIPPGSHTGFSGLHLPFVGFTYTTER